jgi:hypothetical protein
MKKTSSLRSALRPDRLALAVLLLLPLDLGAAEAEIVSAEEVEAAFSEGERLSGREIYDRFLRNKFRTSTATLTMLSTDPGGAIQETELYVRWKDFRDQDNQPANGIIAKTYVRFEKPFDIWRLTYLIVAREDRDHDQFVYLPSSNMTRRVRVRGVGIMGTDYTIDDIAFQNIEDADYTRLPDGSVGGLPVYVVSATMKPIFDTEYRTVIAYITQDRYVMVRALYQDEAGDTLRELEANTETISDYDGVWIATESTMTDVKRDTSSTLLVQTLEANPPLDDQLFSSFALLRRRP